MKKIFLILLGFIAFQLRGQLPNSFQLPVSQITGNHVPFISALNNTGVSDTAQFTASNGKGYGVITKIRVSGINPINGFTHSRVDSNYAWTLSTSGGLIYKTQSATKIAASGNTVTFTGITEKDASTISPTNILLQVKYNNNVYVLKIGDGVNWTGATASTITFNFDTFFTNIAIGATGEFILRAW